MVNTATTEPVKLESNQIDEVETFTYLGSVTDKHDGTDADVKANIGERSIYTAQKHLKL